MPGSLGQGNGKMQTEYNYFQISSVCKHVGILEGRSEKGWRMAHCGLKWDHNLENWVNYPPPPTPP